MRRAIILHAVRIHDAEVAATAATAAAIDIAAATAIAIAIGSTVTKAKNNVATNTVVAGTSSAVLVSNKRKIGSWKPVAISKQCKVTEAKLSDDEDSDVVFIGSSFQK